MKKLLLTTSFFAFTLSALSQMFTQANEPIVGDTKLMYICDSAATNYASVIGNGVTWNYGTIPSYAGETKMVEVLTSASTPFAADFPNATTSILIEDFTYSYYSSTTASRVSHGYVLEGTDLGDIKAKFSADDQILMNYPMTMNAYVNDPFSGNVSFVYNTIPQNPAMAGSSSSKYDGIGTLIQPDGSSLMNVSRFHVQDTAVVTVPILGTSQLIRSQYEYYDLNSTTNFMPVFLHLSAKVISGFPDPLFEETVVLSSVSGSPVAGLKELSAKTHILYPNPAKELFHVNNLKEGTKVQLIDITGRAIELQSIGNSQFSISGIRSGIYTVQFGTDKGIQSQTLVIE